MAAKSGLDYIYDRYMRPPAVAFTPVLDRLIDIGRIQGMPSDLLYFLINGPAAALVQRSLAPGGGHGTTTRAELESLATSLARHVVAALMPDVSLGQRLDAAP
jgi:hypothetical protein